MNPEIRTADPTRNLTVRVPHLQPHRQCRIRGSRVCFHHLHVLGHDTSVSHYHDNGMSVFGTIDFTLVAESAYGNAPIPDRHRAH
ncbi:hypothetical protein GCM10010409_46760 [Mycolicibacterium diernhoferi]